MNEKEAQGETQSLPGAVPPARSGRLTLRRKLLLGLLAFLALVAFCEWLQWPFLRQPLESALRHFLKREITIADGFGVRFFGHLRLRAGRFAIAAAPAPAPGAGIDFVSAAGLRLNIPYTTLFALGGERSASANERRPAPTITALDVDEIRANLVRDKDGNANWRFGAQTPDKGPLVVPQFGRLVIGNGQIRVDDALSELELDAEVRTVDGTGPSTEKTARGLEITAKGTYQGRQLTAYARTSGLIPLIASTAETPPVPMRFEVRAGESELTFDGRAGDVLKLGSLDGDFRLKGPSLAAIGDAVGVTLPTTGAFMMRGKATKDGLLWTVAVAELAVGSSRLNGKFAYDPTGEKPKLTGELGGSRLSLPDLGPAFGTAPPRPGAAAKARRVRGEAGKDPVAAPTSNNAEAVRRESPGRRVLPQREFDLPSLAAMDADVIVALDQLDLGTAQLEELAPLKAHIILAQQTLTLRDIVARAAQGEVRGSLSVNAQGKPPRWTADLSWSRVQLEQFIKARDRADRSGNGDRGYLSGALGGRAKLRGSGSSTAQVLSTLDGEAQMWIGNGAISHLIVEVAGIDIAEAIGMLIKGDDHLPMRCAVAALKVQRGQVVPDVALIETKDSTLLVDGRISLADERLNLVFRTEPKDKSPITLRTPVYIGGTFANPTVSVDKPSVGMRIAAAAALAAVTPFAALLALVDLGEPEKQVCAEAMGRLKSPPKAKSAPRARNSSQR